MTKELIIDILIAICIAGVTLAGILYFLSYDSYDKDVDRRLKESERKTKKGSEICLDTQRISSRLNLLAVTSWRSK